MTLLWNNSLLTGSDLLDNQHKELIKRLKQHIHEKDKKFAAFLKHKET